MKKIHIADDAAGTKRLATVLSRNYDLTFSKNVEDAITFLNETPDLSLIIVGVHFDESKMFDLMSEMKRHASTKGISVMGFAETHTDMTASGRNSNEQSSHYLGASDYVDTTNMSDDEILNRIERCISEKHGVGDVRDGTLKTPTEKREQQERDR